MLPPQVGQRGFPQVLDVVNAASVAGAGVAYEPAILSPARAGIVSARSAHDSTSAGARGVSGRTGRWSAAIVGWLLASRAGA